jgi:hypothetical protein
MLEDKFVTSLMAVESLIFHEDDWLLERDAVYSGKISVIISEIHDAFICVVTILLYCTEIQLTMLRVIILLLKHYSGE